MGIVQKLTTSIREKRQHEDNVAALAVLQANLDYVAMMTDVELESNSEATGTTGTETSEEG